MNQKLVSFFARGLAKFGWDEQSWEGHSPAVYRTRQVDMRLQAQGVCDAFLGPSSLETQHIDADGWREAPGDTHWLKMLMGVLCARNLKSIYIIADRLSLNIDWSGFSILFFSLFPSNRHPLDPSYVSLIWPITAGYIIADWCDTMPIYLDICKHCGCGYTANLCNHNHKPWVLIDKAQRKLCQGKKISFKSHI